MAAFEITITDAGRAEIVNAENTGTGPVEITEIGIGTGQYTPNPSQTALVAEVKRISTISGLVLSPALIHVIGRDDSTDAYSVSEFGLYTESGTLFAVYSQGTPYADKVAGSSFLIAVDVAITTLDATNLTFGDTNFVNPPASESVQGIVELATVAEAQAGTDVIRAVTPEGAHAAFKQFGLGATTVANLTTPDLNANRPTGFYVVSGATNKPAGSSFDGYLYHTAYDSLGSGYAHQRYVNFTAGSGYREWVRTKANGTWSQWYESTTANNLNGVISANTTAAAGWSYHITANALISLPSAASAGAGARIRFTKAFGLEPEVQVDGVELIDTATKGSDTSVILVAETEYIFASNGTRWEV